MRRFLRHFREHGRPLSWRPLAVVSTALGVGGLVILQPSLAVPATIAVGVAALLNDLLSSQKEKDD